MKKLKNIRLLVAFLLFSASSIVTAGLFGSDSKDVWVKNINVYVKYGDQDSSGLGENDHPVQLNAEHLSRVLRSLEIQSDAGGAVFTDQQADTLGRYLTQALAAAKPAQDVLFALDKEAPRPMGLKPRIRYLAGRAFYKDGSLNIILGDYDRPSNVAYESAYDPTGMGIARYAFEHGARSKRSGGFDSLILAGQGITQKQVANGLRRDWFVIDIDTAMAGISQRATQREVRAVGGEDRRRPGEASPAASPATSPALHPAEERLMLLKRLRDQGLITEEEYSDKRKQIVDEL